MKKSSLLNKSNIECLNVLSNNYFAFSKIVNNNSVTHYTNI